MTILYKTLAAFLLVTLVNCASAEENRQGIQYFDNDSTEEITELPFADGQKYESDEKLYEFEDKTEEEQATEVPQLSERPSEVNDFVKNREDLVKAIVAGIMSANPGYQPSYEDVELFVEVAEKNTPINDLTTDQLARISNVLGLASKTKDEASVSVNVKPEVHPQSAPIKISYSDLQALNFKPSLQGLYAVPSAYSDLAGYRPSPYSGLAGYRPSPYPAFAGYRQSPYSALAGYRQSPYSAMAGYRQSPFSAQGYYKRPAYPQSYPVQYQRRPVSYPSFYRNPSSYPSFYRNPSSYQGFPYRSALQSQMPLAAYKQYPTAYPSNQGSYPAYPSSVYPYSFRDQANPSYAVPYKQLNQQGASSKFVVKTPAGDILVLDAATRQATKLDPENSKIYAQSETGELYAYDPTTGRFQN
jgi:hypothetical protein